MRVQEIFSSIQGEGPDIGKKVVFVRFSGCNLRCSWCDTREAWYYEKGKEMTVDEIVDRVYMLKTDYVVLTGGEPLIQNHEQLENLTFNFQLGKVNVGVETNGTVRPSDKLLENVNKWVVSPKLQSAYEVWEKEDREDLAEMLDNWLGISELHDVTFKFVIHSKKDIRELNKGIEKLNNDRFLDDITWVFQPEYNNRNDVFKQLPEWVDNHLDKINSTRVMYLPQIHKDLGLK